MYKSKVCILQFYIFLDGIRNEHATLEDDKHSFTTQPLASSLYTRSIYSRYREHIVSVKIHEYHDTHQQWSISAESTQLRYSVKQIVSVVTYPFHNNFALNSHEDHLARSRCLSFIGIFLCNPFRCRTKTAMHCDLTSSCYV